MKLVDASRILSYLETSGVVVAMCVRASSLTLTVKNDPIHDPQGHVVCLQRENDDAITVGDQGILQYFQQYVSHLMTGVFRIVTGLPRPGLFEIRTIDLPPDAGDAVSVSVTHGIEVRASARWDPYFDEGYDDDDANSQDAHDGLRFGFSIHTNGQFIFGNHMSIDIATLRIC